MGALWVIIWLLILIFISFEVAGFCAFFYIILLPITVCIPELSVCGQIANYYLLSLLLHHACCYIYFIQTNSCTFFKTHSHSHLKLLIVKNVCKTHQLKPYMFRSQLFDHLQGGHLSYLVLLLPFLLVCLIYLVCGRNVVYVCACLMYLSVGCLVVSSQPNIPQTSTSGTHTHR